VRVLNGPHAGERGMVVSVDGTQCVLLPDTRQVELKVFVRDLTEAKESGTGGFEQTEGCVGSKPNNWRVWLGPVGLVGLWTGGCRACAQVGPNWVLQLIVGRRVRCVL
jgi:hypothetical protein